MLKREDQAAAAAQRESYLISLRKLDDQQVGNTYRFKKEESRNNVVTIVPKTYKIEPIEERPELNPRYIPASQIINDVEATATRNAQAKTNIPKNFREVDQHLQGEINKEIITKYTYRQLQPGRKR